MKQCFYQHQWGGPSRRIFEHPPGFGDKQGDLENNTEDELETIDTSDRLDHAKEDLKRSIDIKKLVEAGDKKRLESVFNFYITTLNRQYFKPDLLPKGDRRKYVKNSKEFERAIQKRTAEQLDHLWEEKGKDSGSFTQEKMIGEMQAMKEGLEKMYEQFSQLEKKDGIIDLDESEALLRVMGYEARIKHQDLASNLRMLSGENEEQSIFVLQSMYFFKPRVWEKTVSALADELFSKASRDANEGVLIALANKMEGAENFEDHDFRGAKNYLEKEVTREGKRGVKGTLKLVQNMEEALDPKLEQRLEEYSKFSLYYRAKFLNEGPQSLKADYEQIVVRFMRAKPKERETILENTETRERLFRGIYITQIPYKKEYKGYFRTDSARKNERLREKHASLGALVILGEDAQAVIKNFDQTPKFKDLDLTVEMEKMQTDIAGEFPRYKHLPKAKFNRGVLSRLEVQGFNGRDMAVGGAKVVAMATFIVNSINTIHQAKGDNMFEKLGNGIKDIATLKNPTVALSAAVVFGARTLEKNPQYYDYPGSGGYQQKGMGIARQLRAISDKTSYNRVEAFKKDKMEWKMMEYLQKNPNDLKEVIKIAETRRRENKRRVALVTKKDLEPFLPSEIYENMSEDPHRTDVRYRFLTTFLVPKNASNINIVEDHASDKGNIIT